MNGVQFSSTPFSLKALKYNGIYVGQKIPDIEIWTLEDLKKLKKNKFPNKIGILRAVQLRFILYQKFFFAAEGKFCRLASTCETSLLGLQIKCFVSKQIIGPATVLTVPIVSIATELNIPVLL